MVRTKIRSCILLALLTGLIPCFAATAAAAASGSGAQVIADCQAHQRLTHLYTVAQLQNALATLPPDVAEYSNCQQVIEAALTHPGGKGANNGAGNSSGSSFLPTPVIVILVLLILAAVTFGAISVRRRGDGQGPDRQA
jgi:hypothetical protein